MGRSVMLGNGSMLVGLNEHGLVHDFYYPYVGMENLTTARSVHHMVGIWVDGQFSWLDDGSWNISTNFEDDALFSDITAQHNGLGIKLHFTDFVDIGYDAFCRKVDITNEWEAKRDVRIFFHQVFQISNAGRADTALFVPQGNYILDYKGNISLLVYACNAKTGNEFDQFAVGNFGIEGKEGTFKDAEDGELSNNLVEHGGVDSVIRCRVMLDEMETGTVHYWAVADTSQTDVEEVHEALLKEGFENRMEQTRKWWHRWLSIGVNHMHLVDKEYLHLFKKSLMVVKAHIDRHGGIIASGDSSIYNYGRDYYSYVWPRDGALTMLPLIELGYTQEPKRFFEFCADTIHHKGYMMHKYQPDRAIGSTWHPLMHKDHPELAIQEDETAAVIYAVGQYFTKTNDEDFIKRIYTTLIKPAGNFMARFIDDATNLPHATYDLWEERFATHTYTVYITIAALLEAAKLADACNKPEDAKRWRAAASRIRDGLKLLYNSERQCYRKSILLLPNGDLEFNNTIDASSFYGVMMFDDCSIDDDDLAKSVLTTKQTLKDKSPSGGVVRYENDSYFMNNKPYIGNPWLICTLWISQYYIRKGDLNSAKPYIDWVISRKTPSDILPEQVDPDTGGPLSVTPLVWSHAELVATFIEMNKLQHDQAKI